MRKAGDGTATSAQGKSRVSSSSRALQYLPSAKARKRATETLELPPEMALQDITMGEEYHGKSRVSSSSRASPRGRETSGASPAPNRGTAASKAKAKSKARASTAARASPASARSSEPVSSRFSKVNNKSSSPPARPVVRPSTRDEVLPADDSSFFTDPMDAADAGAVAIDLQGPAGAPTAESPTAAPLVCDSTLQPIESHTYGGKDDSSDENASATVFWPNAAQENLSWQDQLKDVSVTNGPQSFANESQVAADTGAVQTGGPPDMMNELSWRLQAKPDGMTYQDEWQPPAVLESMDHQARVSASRTSAVPALTMSPRPSVPIPGLSPRASVDTRLSQEEDNEDLKALAERLEKGVETLVGMAAGATEVETNKAERRDTHVVISQMQQEIAELKARVGVGRNSTANQMTSVPFSPLDPRRINNAGGADGGAGGEVVQDKDPLVWEFRNSNAAAFQQRGVMMYGQGNASTAPVAAQGPALSMLWGASADVEPTREPLPPKGDLTPPLTAGEYANTQMYQPAPASEEHLQHLLRDVYDKICVCSARVNQQKASSELGVSDLNFNTDSLFRAVTDDEVSSRRETWKEIDCLRQALVSMHQHLQFAQQRTRVLEQQCQEYERHVQQLTQPTAPLVATVLPTQENPASRAASKPATPRESRSVTPVRVSAAHTPHTSRPASPGRDRGPFASAVSPNGMNANVSYSWAPTSSSRVPSAGASLVAAATPAALGFTTAPLSARGGIEHRASSAPRSVSSTAGSRLRVRVSGGTTPVLPLSAAGSIRVTASREATPRKIAPTTPLGSSVREPAADGSMVFEPYMTVSPACLPWVSAVADGFMTPSPVNVPLPPAAAGLPAAPGPRPAASPAPAAQRFISVSSSGDGAKRLASASPKPAQRLQSAGPGYPLFTLVPASPASTPAATPRQACLKTC